MKFAFHHLPAGASPEEMAEAVSAYVPPGGAVLTADGEFFRALAIVLHQFESGRLAPPMKQLRQALDQAYISAGLPPAQSNVPVAVDDEPTQARIPMPDVPYIRGEIGGATVTQILGGGTITTEGKAHPLPSASARIRRKQQLGGMLQDPQEYASKYPFAMDANGGVHYVTEGGDHVVDC